MTEMMQIGGLENPTLTIDYISPLENIDCKDIQNWMQTELLQGIDGIKTQIKDKQIATDHPYDDSLRNQLSQIFKIHFSRVRGLSLLIKGYATAKRSTESDELENIIRNARTWRSTKLQTVGEMINSLDKLVPQNIAPQDSDIHHVNETVLEVFRILGSYRKEEDIMRQTPVKTEEPGLGATAHFMNYALEIIGYAYEAGSNLSADNRDSLEYQKIQTQMGVLASQLEWMREKYQQDPDNHSAQLKEVILRVSSAIRATIKLPNEAST